MDSNKEEQVTQTPSVEQPKKEEIQREQIQAAKVYKLEKPVEEEKPVEVVVEEQPVEEEKIVVPPKKEKNILARLLFIVILILAGIIAYQQITYNSYKNSLINYYSPITASEEKELDIDSTIVKDLYGKYSTNAREDYIETNLTDELKLYLAYRNLSKDKFREDECTGFDEGKMVPFKCDVTKKTESFHTEALETSYKTLFGAQETVPDININLRGTCFIGYEKIGDKYVKGECVENTASPAIKEAKVISATSQNSKIVIKEQVKYSTRDGKALPERLKSGVYIYTFYLDSNYNYVLRSKTLEQE